MAPPSIARDVSAAARTLGPELEFLRLVWRLDHALQRRSKLMGSELGVTGPQRLVLRIVGRFPGIPPGELADLLCLHPGTVSGILRRLEKGGWLTVRTDPRDRRRALLGLTPRGHELDLHSRATIEGAVHRILMRHPTKNVEAARRVLDGLAGELLAETRSARSR